MSRVSKKFSDLNFDFMPHPVSGDIVPLKDSESVKRSLRNLMLTGTYERLFQPDLGANLKQLLFEPISPMTQLSIQLLISDIIRLYEPRVSIVNLQVSIPSTEDGYNVHLVFAIDNLSEVTTANFFLERLR
jgi:phage baseplate assembly protein W